MPTPPGSQREREEPVSPSPVRNVEVDSTSMWDPLLKVPGYAPNTALAPQTPKANRFLDVFIPNTWDQDDPTKTNTRRLKRNQNSMTFKNQEFNFLDSLVEHLGYLLSSPEANPTTRSVGLEVKKGVETLKGQIVDLKDVMHALSQAVNPATLGAKTAETPEILQADSPSTNYLKKKPYLSVPLIKEKPQKLVMIFNGLFMAKCIPSEVYQKTPGAERAASKMSPFLRIRAAQRLKSRDLRLHLYHASKVQLAIDTQEVWLPHLESGWSIKRKSFPIIVHAVPTSFDINSKEEVQRRIEPFNLNLCEHIAKISWCRTKKMSSTPSEKVKTHSSLIIALDLALVADALIEFGLIIDGKAYTVENVKNLVTPSRDAKLQFPAGFAPAPTSRRPAPSPAQISNPAVMRISVPIDQSSAVYVLLLITMPSPKNPGGLFPILCEMSGDLPPLPEDLLNQLSYSASPSVSISSPPSFSSPSLPASPIAGSRTAQVTPYQNPFLTSSVTKSPNTDEPQYGNSYSDDTSEASYPKPSSSSLL
ncbi:hypothetical protein BT69DRAFT_1384253 [Atractiella rhizophila]|nr:hypothetical protein BT69DRAFT_1384253 [Atractiella rhizophila]